MSTLVKRNRVRILARRRSTPIACTHEIRDCNCNVNEPIMEWCVEVRW